MPEPATTPTTSAEVRARLVEALKLDLLGRTKDTPWLESDCPGTFGHRPDT